MASLRDKQSDVNRPSDEEQGIAGSATTGSTTSGMRERSVGEGATAGEMERPVPVSTERSADQGATRGKVAPAIGWPSYYGGLVSSPWEIFRAMNDEMNQLFDNFGLGRSPGAFAQPRTAVSRPGRSAGLTSELGMLNPEVEVIHKDNALVVRADLPGLNADEINVNVDDGVLVITGERKKEQKEDREGFYRSEFRYGTFYRAIPLPRGADEDKIAANFKNGVLEVNVPVSAEQQGKKIEVKG